MSKAMDVTELKPKNDIVNYALSELVRLNKRKSMMQYRGKLLREGNLDETRTMRQTY